MLRRLMLRGLMLRRLTDATDAAARLMLRGLMRGRRLRRPLAPRDAAMATWAAAALRLVDLARTVEYVDAVAAAARPTRGSDGRATNPAETAQLARGFASLDAARASEDASSSANDSLADAKSANRSPTRETRSGGR